MQPQQRSYPLTKLTGFFSFQPEVLVRRNFGERYHTVTKTFWHLLLLSGFTAAFYYGISWAGHTLLGASLLIAVLFGFFAFAFLITSIFQQVTIHMRHSRREPRHSDHHGDSWDFWSTLPLPFNSDDHTVKAFLEPLPFLIAATILFFTYFGGYLLICSIS